MTTPTMPRPMPRPVAATPTPPARKTITLGTIGNSHGNRIVLYGAGGIGKTTLAAQMPGKTAFVDLDDSLPRLRKQLEAQGYAANIAPIEGIASWQDLRDALAADGWGDIKNIVIDTGTRAEELCVAQTLATVKHDKGHKAERLEDYGFGKGYQHVYDTFLPLMGDLDRHARQGRNVVIICHDCTTTVPNPAGEDWLRYEPRLQNPSSGKASIRLRVKEWADHVLFLGYDVDVSDNRKARGSGTRTIYPAELPHCLAKSRATQTPIPLTSDNAAEVWATILA